MPTAPTAEPDGHSLCLALLHGSLELDERRGDSSQVHPYHWCNTLRAPIQSPVAKETNDMRVKMIRFCQSYHLASDKHSSFAIISDHLAVGSYIQVSDNPCHFFQTNPALVALSTLSQMDLAVSNVVQQLLCRLDGERGPSTRSIHGIM